MKITVLGSGSWGMALAWVLSQKADATSFPIILWGRNQELMKKIEETRSHPTFVPNQRLGDRVRATSSMEEALKEADIVLFAVPSRGMREVAQKASAFIKPEAFVVSCVKGFEDLTYRRISQILEEELEPLNPKIAVLTGPNHAEEVILGEPTATLIASSNLKTAQQIQDCLAAPSLRIYTSEDLIGAELGGALKNVIALSVGIASGLGLGDNAKAALMTRGLAEIARLGVAMGAHPMTFTGLSGVGDLIATCTSEHSRNFRAGRLFAQGKKRSEVELEIGMVVEGIRATEAAIALAERYHISVPIADQLHQVITESKSPRDALEELMSRNMNHELEQYYTS